MTFCLTAWNKVFHRGNWNLSKVKQQIVKSLLWSWRCKPFQEARNSFGFVGVHDQGWQKKTKIGDYLTHSTRLIIGANLKNIAPVYFCESECALHHIVHADRIWYEHTIFIHAFVLFILYSLNMEVRVRSSVFYGVNAKACAVRPGGLGAAQSGGFPPRDYGVKGAACSCTTWHPWVRVHDSRHGYMVYLLTHCYSLTKRTLQLSVYSVPQPHTPSGNPTVDDCPCSVNGRCLGFHPGVQPTEVLGCPHVRGTILALKIW